MKLRTNDPAKLPISIQESLIADYDDTYLLIFSGLSHYLSNTVESSVEQIIELSHSFLSDEATQAISDFHRLYEANAGIDAYKNSINDQVDELLNYIQNHDSVDKTGELTALECLDQGELSSSNLSISTLQKDIEALVTMEADIKNRILPIIHSLQFEEQVIDSIKQAEIFVGKAMSLVHEQSEKFDSFAAAFTLYNMINVDEAKEVFLQVFVSTKHPLNSPSDQADRNPSGPWIFDNVPMDLGKIDFLRRVIGYTSVSLAQSMEQASIGIDEVIMLLTEVTDKAAFVTGNRSENEELLDSLRAISVAGDSDKIRIERQKLISSTLDNTAEIGNKLNSFVMSIVSTIQFQDRVRQNSENLSLSLESWLRFRPDLEAMDGLLMEEQLKQLGETLLSAMTMPEERDVVHLHIKNLPEADDVVEDDDLLF